MKTLKNGAALILLSIVSIYCSAAITLNGVSSYQDFGEEKFLSALYLSVPDQSPEHILASDQAMRLEMRLTTTLSKRTAVNLWAQSIAINNSKEAFQAEADQVARLFASIHSQLLPGDIVRLDYEPGAGASFSINQTLFMSDLSKNLFTLFLRSWIGPVPPSSDFRDDILGKTAPDQELVARLQQTQPSRKRINAIAKWVTPAEPDQTTDEKQESQAEKTTVVVTKPDQQNESPKQESADAPVTDVTMEPASQKNSAEEDSKAEPAPEEEADVSVASLLAQQEYSTHTLGKIYKTLRYPKVAVRRGHQGSVRLQLHLLRDGTLDKVTLVQETKYSSLNEAAIKAAEKASPFNPVPDAISDDELSFTVPISFKLVSD